MSMLQAQADELRELAVRANDLYEYEMEVALDGAADTILSLRDRAQELQAENARLREQLQEAEHEESVAWDRVRKAEREIDWLRAARDMWQENDAKLRELVRALIRATHPADRATLIEQAAELGIEVPA